MRLVVYPVPGFYLEGIPQVPLKVPSADVADRLERTGAFSREGSGDAEYSLTDAEIAAARLDHYDPPLKHGEHYLHPERVNLARLDPDAREVVEARLKKLGGPVSGGSTVLVGERGPELVVPTTEPEE